MSSILDEHLWWQKGIIYQIYPRSFMDSNGDGVGDLKGIANKLDYLKWLGVDAIWISPIYPSPMADFGYDISNYTDIHPLFGSIEDFDNLLAQSHKNGIKVILDLVPNHTSDKHPWFLESRSSRDNPKRDWYLWHDAAPEGGPPNNWLSVFGGIAWEWDEKTEQYYYHGFLKEQPDLNWRNPEVQKAMLDVMKFWLDRGIDGFRVDVIYHIIKDRNWRNNPPNPDYLPHMATYEKLHHVYSVDQPEVMDIVHMMRKVMDEYDQKVLIGEIYLPLQRIMAYYGTENSGAHLPYNFQLITMQWNARLISNAIDEYEGSLPEGGWPNWVLGNHDQSRVATRLGTSQAKIAALLLLTLRGTPTIYYGDEIGMKDTPIAPEEIKDPQGLNMPDLNLSRDPQRTPMQWNRNKNAGFSEVKPWLPVSDNYPRINVETQKNDPISILSLYKRLLELRKREPALNIGSYVPVPADGDLLSYLREHEGKKFLIVLNMGRKPRFFTPKTVKLKGKIVVGTHIEKEGQLVSERVMLKGDEGVVVELD